MVKTAEEEANHGFGSKEMRKHEKVVQMEPVFSGSASWKNKANRERPPPSIAGNRRGEGNRTVSGPFPTTNCEKVPRIVGRGGRSLLVGFQPRYPGK